ncbi:hypothetical protein [Paludisphaera borealis]|uniref:Uncharacterized protein n=1 Tax=Paludisphaera borealis TaxID=1387353 RepID=A0A1U7CV38_9BACT|nr:hypothetical protein [Paludisphaera borealis]APW62810.1 hypothetical protein BSF38_04364 [Paludisphaera borealis]
MHRLVTATILAGVIAGPGLFGEQGAQAAPAPSNYSNIEKSISVIRQGWARPGATQDPNAPGWNVFFTAILDDLKAYSQAPTPADRLTPLNRLYQMSAAMAVVPWQPAQTVREELRAWLRPRVRLAWAERRLDDTVRGLPPTTDPSVQANRQRWVDFVDNDLGQALGQFHAATTVAQRQAGLNHIHQALGTLNQRNAERPWQPSADLQTAINDLFNQPNLDVTADLSIVGPIFDQNLVTSGPIYRKGYWSQVTAGPKTGFGLLASDDGIAFYNSQQLQSSTPITDFQNQIASDQQGQRVAKLYQFTATTIDQAEQTIYAVLRTSGLTLTPASTHNVNAQICSNPQPGKGLPRAIGGLLGFNQNKITDLVYQNALPQFQQRIPVEAQEEAEERIAAELAQRNADINRFLIGNNTLAVQEFLVSGLSLRSRPDAVYVGGLFQSRAGDKQRGADAPQPAQLAVPAAGLTADIHLGSVLTSAVDGLYQRGPVQSIQNVMIVTHDVPPGTPPAQAATVTTNVDFPTYLKAVDEAVKAKNPKIQAIRIRRPAQPPEFAADARGFVVAILHDLEIDVPAPDPTSRTGAAVGANAKVLRIKIPQAETAFSYKIESASATSHYVRARVEEFTPATTSMVLAIKDDETKPTTLNRFSGALVISALAAKLRSQPLNANLDNLKLRGFAIQSISPLDPSGWVRLNLVKAYEAPAPVNPVQPVTEPMAAPEIPVAQPAEPGAIPVQVQVPAQAAVVTYPQ